MAKQGHGILSEFTGKVGNVVGSSWKGIPVLRAAPSTYKKRFSKSQIEQQARFMLLTRFLRPISELLNQTFKNYASKMSCFNKAFSVNKETVIGLYPSYRIDYSSILLGLGNLSGAEDIETSSPKPGHLRIKWCYQKSLKSRALRSDRVFVAAYCEELDEWFCDSSSAHRSDGGCKLKLPAFTRRQVQTYMGFISEDGKRTSKGLYLGKVNIT
jgi:hypothetical protein